MLRLDELVEVALTPSAPASSASAMVPLRDIMPAIAVTPEYIEKLYEDLRKDTRFGLTTFAFKADDHRRYVKNYITRELQQTFDSEKDLNRVLDALLQRFSQPIDSSWIEMWAQELYLKGKPKGFFSEIKKSSRRAFNNSSFNASIKSFLS